MSTSRRIVGIAWNGLTSKCRQSGSQCITGPCRADPVGRHVALKLLAVVSVLCVTPVTSSHAAADASRSFKAEVLFKLAHPCPTTGQATGACAGYVIDRVIPLECGGAEDPSNMQWQTIAEAKAKDRWERIGCRPGRKLVMPGTPAFSESYPMAVPDPITEVQPLTNE